MESYSLNLSTGYIKDWSVKEGLREIIANAYDEGDISITHVDGFAVIGNQGNVYWRHLTLGCSEKQSETAIGQFGEGLKVGALALVRAGRQVKLFSDDVSCEFVLRPWQGTIVLFADEVVNQAPKIGRTTVLVECSQEELYEAETLFVPNGHRDQILEHTNGIGPVKLYVRGVYAQTLEQNGYADYNLSDRQVTNRDRSILDLDKVKKILAQAIINQGQPEIWFNRLTSKVNVFEKVLYYYHWYGATSEGRNRWQEYAKTYGERVAVAIDFNSSKVNWLKDGNWTVLPVNYFTESLFTYCGFQRIDAAIIIERQRRLDIKDDTVELIDLASDEQLMLGRLADISGLYLGFTGNIFIVKDNPEFIAMANGGNVYLTRGVLSFPLKDALIATSEEICHCRSCATDLTREMQGMYNIMLSELIMRCLNENSNPS